METKAKFNVILSSEASEENAHNGETRKTGTVGTTQFKRPFVPWIMGGESNGNELNELIPCLREHNAPCFVKYSRKAHFHSRCTEEGEETASMALVWKIKPI